MVAADLAQLYEVETKRLNEQVKRNPGRFPADFMFQLTKEEFDDLKSQFATSSWGGSRRLPFVCSEHGAIMAAAVLNSDRAVEMSVYVVRAFVELRNQLSNHRALRQRVDQLERRVGHHDNSLAEVIDTIRSMVAQPRSAKRPIGFTADISRKPQSNRSSPDSKI